MNGVPNVRIAEALMVGNCVVQEGVMPSARRAHRDPVTLPEVGTAVDIGEEKGHRA
ncbi:MAG: hypothetical protein H0V00_10595 [Chloroflexia bacterium]|nr:hypothetical protein [Chloroflexia bacterium]